MKKKVIITIIVVLLIIAGSVLTGLYIIGDKIIDEVIDMEMSIPTENQDNTVINPSSNEENVSDTPTNEGNKHVPTSETSVAVSTGDKSANVNNVGEEKNKPSSPVVTVKKMQEVKEKVTPQDKISAAAMVMSKLSSDDIDELQGMLAGGLTAEEKSKAKSIAYSKFSGKEIEEIKKIYHKYMNDTDKSK